MCNCPDITSPQQQQQQQHPRALAEERPSLSQTYLRSFASESGFISRFSLPGLYVLSDLRTRRTQNNKKFNYDRRRVRRCMQPADPSEMINPRN